ncbi:MAG: hypothetical protein ACI8SK_000946, partial [Shewanella sp.]
FSISAIAAVEENISVEMMSVLNACLNILVSHIFIGGLPS